jgi:branched-chain amino acid transport system substrate-binding protein
MNIDGFLLGSGRGVSSLAKRFFERTGRMPGMVQAGTYSAVLHYLKAIEAAGTADGKAIADKIRELPVDDFFAKGRVRETAA